MSAIPKASTRVKSSSVSSGTKSSASAGVSKSARSSTTLANTTSSNINSSTSNNSQKKSSSMPDLFDNPTTSTTTKTQRVPRPKSEGNNIAPIRRLSNSSSSSSTTSLPRIGSGSSSSLSSTSSLSSSSAPPAHRILERISTLLKESDSGITIVESGMTRQTGANVPIQIVGVSSKKPSSAKELAANMNSLSMKDPLVQQNSDLDLGQNTEKKRKLVRLCNDLRRLCDKEDASLINALFSKNLPNVSTLFKCTKLVTDIDISLNAIAVVSHLIVNTDMGPSHIPYLAKKNVTTVFLRCLKQAHSDTLSNSELAPKFEELCGHLLPLLLRLSKTDPKMPIIARLHGAIEPILYFMELSYHKNVLPQFYLGVDFLLVCTKNENNCATIFKSECTPVFQTLVHQFCKEVPPGRWHCVLNLLTALASLAKYNSIIQQDYSMEQLLSLFVRAGNQNMVLLQKAVIKFIKVLVISEDGKEAFREANGLSVLHSSLEKILQQSETSATNTASPNSLPNLVTAVLRSSLPDEELPLLDQVERRSFETKKAPGIINDPASSPDFNANTYFEQFFPEFKSNSIVLEAITANNTGEILVHHVQPFFSEGAPSFACIDGPERLWKRPKTLIRRVICDQTDRFLQDQQSARLVVYDIMNSDIAREFEDKNDVLNFDSRFESGNLQFASKMAEYEYDLFLQSDINTTLGRHNQWFYFSVGKMKAGVPYKFNIINLSKPQSQFNFGMQPVMFSSTDGKWSRVGDDIYYYKNQYRRVTQENSNSLMQDTHATLTFTVTFPHDNDTCWIAYHYPYTYSSLQSYLNQQELLGTNAHKLRRQLLCKSLHGNRLDLLTITNFNSGSFSEFPLENRRYVFLSGRVHPGESNASHIVHGFLEYLLSEDAGAVALRNHYVFKIIPMLNPDGVINGNHRCSLLGVDLNRQWSQPKSTAHPEIFWTKELLRWMCDQGKRPLLTCDFHGHSRKKSAFMFACENAAPVANIEKLFTSIYASMTPAFSAAFCKYSVEKSKESTARVIIWREFQVACAYTLESTFAGGDFGEWKKIQFSIPILQEIGVVFCKALLEFGNQIKDVPLSAEDPDSLLSVDGFKGVGGKLKKSGSNEDINENNNDDEDDGDDDDDDDG